MNNKEFHLGWNVATMSDFKVKTVGIDLGLPGSVAVLLRKKNLEMVFCWHVLLDFRLQQNRFKLYPMFPLKNQLQSWCCGLESPVYSTLNFNHKPHQSSNLGLLAFLNFVPLVTVMV